MDQKKIISMEAGNLSEVVSNAWKIQQTDRQEMSMFVSSDEHPKIKFLILPYHPRNPLEKRTTVRCTVDMTLEQFSCTNYAEKTNFFKFGGNYLLWARFCQDEDVYIEFLAKEILSETYRQSLKSHYHSHLTQEELEGAVSKANGLRDSLLGHILPHFDKKVGKVETTLSGSSNYNIFLARLITNNFIRHPGTFIVQTSSENRSAEIHRGIDDGLSLDLSLCGPACGWITESMLPGITDAEYDAFQRLIYSLIREDLKGTWKYRDTSREQ